MSNNDILSILSLSLSLPGHSASVSPRSICLIGQCPDDADSLGLSRYMYTNCIAVLVSFVD